MMTEKEFIESQKECAAMLGMSLSEYEKYCKNLKVSNEKEEISKEGNTDEFLDFLGIGKEILKVRKDW